MDVLVDLRALELLNSRLCHELISPVGAINNGVELMEEEDPDFVKEAMKLVASSAKTAGRRLNFYRFAYGSGRGSSGSEAAMGLLEGSKVKGEWDSATTGLPIDWQRLACNMVVIAAEILPRGGTVKIMPGPGGTGVVVSATGDSLNLTEEVRAALGPSASIEALGARSIHAYYTAKVAEALSARIEIDDRQQSVVTFKTVGGV
jgi:histidine phosphotransferase ChpT